MKYRPENAKTNKQKFLVYHNLYHHWVRWTHKHHPRQAESMNLHKDKTQLVWIEGLPGVGKTFVILTLRNIVRNIHQRNSADLATAPTGCAAAHIHGSTNTRSYSIPIGEEAKKPPKNLSSSNKKKLEELSKLHRKVTAYLDDEHSMDSRARHVRKGVPPPSQSSPSCPARPSR